MLFWRGFLNGHPCPPHPRALGSPSETSLFRGGNCASPHSSQESVVPNPPSSSRNPFLLYQLLPPPLLRGSFGVWVCSWPPAEKLGACSGAQPEQCSSAGDALAARLTRCGSWHIYVANVRWRCDDRLKRSLFAEQMPVTPCGASLCSPEHRDCTPENTASGA